MRDILFRGKIKDNGEWVEGYYEFGYDAETEEPSHYMWVLNHTEKYGEMFMVIPETVGQYTGLTDKNGKKVFEGDIFVYDNETTYLVKWDYEYCGFYAEAVEEYNDYDVLGNFYSSLCEVIGNIHDNKELLEVK